MATHIDQLYHRSYYLNDCEGHDGYLRSSGVRLSRRLRKCLQLLTAAKQDMRPDDRAIDLGCGRGELSLHLARGGMRVIAVDPSTAACSLMREAQLHWGLGTRAPRALQGDGCRLPLRDNCAGAVLLSDVIEHIAPSRLNRFLGECARVLRPAGRLVIHTQPNRHLVRYTVPALSHLSFLWGVRLPRDLRDEMTPGARGAYHPGEQTRSGLQRQLLAAGFTVEDLWLEGSYPVHRIFGNGRLKDIVLARFRRTPWLKELLASQIFAIARKASERTSQSAAPM